MQFAVKRKYNYKIIVKKYWEWGRKKPGMQLMFSLDSYKSPTCGYNTVSLSENVFVSIAYTERKNKFI